ncbi:MAG: hypothetical protein ABJA34_07120 [Pseudonocardiales bacterium]
MLILGLLLLVAAAVLTLGVLVAPTARVNVELFGHLYKNVSAAELFVIGLCTGVVLLVGLVLFFSGSRRGARKRKARRAEDNANRSRESDLQEENARLARELAQQRRSGPASSPPATPSGSTARAQSGPASSPPATAGPGSAGSPSAGSSAQERTSVTGSPPPSETPEKRG